MTITLDNQTFPVKANMRAWRAFEVATGNKVATLDSEDVTPVSYTHLTLPTKA